MLGLLGADAGVLASGILFPGVALSSLMLSLLVKMSVKM